MLKKVLKEKSGFTLIEVVIVLAIGALIILVVLQAVGAAQKAQRDTTRKSEAGRMVALLEQYASNNGGTYPGTAALAQSAVQTYDQNLGAKYPSFTVGGTYDPATPTPGASCAPAGPSTYSINYIPSAPAGARDYNLFTCLESGSATGWVQIKPAK